MLTLSLKNTWLPWDYIQYTSFYTGVVWIANTGDRIGLLNSGDGTGNGLRGTVMGHEMAFDLLREYKCSR